LKYFAEDIFANKGQNCKKLNFPSWYFDRGLHCSLKKAKYILSISTSDFGIYKHVKSMCLQYLSDPTHGTINGQ